MDVVVGAMVVDVVVIVGVVVSSVVDAVVEYVGKEEDDDKLELVWSGTTSRESPDVLSRGHIQGSECHKQRKQKLDKGMVTQQHTQ